MTRSEEKQIIAGVLLEVAGVLNDGAAGPTDFWFKKLAERLIERAIKLVEDASQSH